MIWAQQQQLAQISVGQDAEIYRSILEPTWTMGLPSQSKNPSMVFEIILGGTQTIKKKIQQTCVSVDQEKTKIDM